MTDTSEGASTASVNPPRTAYTVSEVAALLELSKWQVSNLCRQGRLSSFKAGKHVRVPVAAIADYRRGLADRARTCTAREAAESLGLPVQQIRELCRSGDLDHDRHGTHLRIPLDALTAYVDRATDSAA